MLAAYAARADEQVSFHFEPPAGFELLESDAARELIAIASTERMDERDRIWVYDRVEDDVLTQRIILMQVWVADLPVTHPEFLRGVREETELAVARKGMTLSSSRAGRLPDGTPCVFTTADGEVDGVPLSVRSAIIPRRSFRLQLAVSAAGPVSEAEWMELLRGLVVQAPPPDPSRPAFDKARYDRGKRAFFRTLFIVSVGFLAIRWVRRAPKGEDDAEDDRADEGD